MKKFFNLIILFFLVPVLPLAITIFLMKHGILIFSDYQKIFGLIIELLLIMFWLYLVLNKTEEEKKEKELKEREAKEKISFPQKDIQQLKIGEKIIIIDYLTKNIPEIIEPFVELYDDLRKGSQAEDRIFILTGDDSHPESGEICYVHEDENKKRSLKKYPVEEKKKTA